MYAKLNKLCAIRIYTKGLYWHKIKEPNGKSPEISIFLNKIPVLEIDILSNLF